MDKLNISAGTIARTIILALAIINQVLTVTGHSPLPIEDEAIRTPARVTIPVIMAATIVSTVSPP
jgi:SPP1 family holin